MKVISIKQFDKSRYLLFNSVAEKEIPRRSHDPNSAKLNHPFQRIHLFKDLMLLLGHLSAKLFIPKCIFTANRDFGGIGLNLVWTHFPCESSSCWQNLVHWNFHTHFLQGLREPIWSHPFLWKDGWIFNSWNLCGKYIFIVRFIYLFKQIGRLLACHMCIEVSNLYTADKMNFIT